MTVAYQISAPRKGFFDFIAILIAGAAGVASALVADFIQKGDASAIFVVDAMVSQYLMLSLPPMYLAAGLMIAGATAVFIFEPESKKSAFYTGASILAVLWTGMPGSSSEGVAPEIIDGGVVLEEGATDADPVSWQGNIARLYATQTLGFDDCAYGTIGEARVISASLSTGCLTEVQMSSRSPVSVTVVLPSNNGLPKMVVYLYNTKTGKKIDLSSIGKARRTNEGYVVFYNAALDLPQGSTVYARVEADGYKISQGQASVSSGKTTIPMVMEQSTTPLWLQRLRTSRRF